MTRLALLRHFPTGWNAEGRIQGRTDIPLSDEGRAALARHRLPPPWDRAPVLASPLARARETAETLAGAPPVFDARLMEIDFGRWEGRLGADLLSDPASGYSAHEFWGWDYRPHGGESPRDMAGRLAPLLAECAGGPDRLIVTHRGVIRCLLALATGWPYLGPAPFALKNAALQIVELSPEGTPAGLGEVLRLPRL